MVKVIALVTLVVGKNKEFKAGSECDLSEKEANQLAKRGFVKLIAKSNVTENNGDNNAPSSSESGQQPV